MSFFLDAPARLLQRNTDLNALSFPKRPRSERGNIINHLIIFQIQKKDCAKLDNSYHLDVHRLENQSPERNAWATYSVFDVMFCLTCRFSVIWGENIRHEKQEEERKDCFHKTPTTRTWERISSQQLSYKAAAIRDCGELRLDGETDQGVVSKPADEVETN